MFFRFEKSKLLSFISSKMDEINLFTQKNILSLKVTFLNCFPLGPVVTEDWSIISSILGGKWTPHTVELAIWTHYIARDIKPELLDDMPGLDANKSPNKYSGSPVNGEEEAVNGNKDGGSSSSEKNDEDSCDSVVEEQNGGVNQKSGAGSADQNGGGATEQQDPSTEQNGAPEVKEVSTEQNGASEAQETGGSEQNGSGEIEKKETEPTLMAQQKSPKAIQPKKRLCRLF